MYYQQTELISFCVFGLKADVIRRCTQKFSDCFV